MKLGFVFCVLSGEWAVVRGFGAGSKFRGRDFGVGFEPLTLKCKLDNS